MNPKRSNRHDFVLNRWGISAIEAAAQGQRLEVLKKIILGELPGWMCKVCGLDSHDLVTLGAEIGTSEVASTLVIRCEPRGSVVWHAGAGSKREVLLDRLCRVDTATMKRIGQPMVTLMEERDWNVPFLGSDGRLRGLRIVTD
jgi:hypothetical protein